MAWTCRTPAVTTTTALLDSQGQQERLGALSRPEVHSRRTFTSGAAAAEEEGEEEEEEMERNWSVAGEEHLRGPDQREVMPSPTAVKAP